MFAEDTMLHISLARNHDLILIAPASANFIAKIACGFAETLSLSVILAAKIPIFLAPAMNPAMYKNDATQNNLNILKKRKNFTIIGPDYGIVACNEEGLGKLAKFEEISRFINANVKQKGKTAIVNLGSTREYLDPVRFIGNYSSGQQGLLIANELINNGFMVQIIAGHVMVNLPNNNVLRAYNAKEMLDVSCGALPCDVYISVAAICDFKAISYAAEKIKKSAQNNYSLELQPNIDVVSSIANHENRPSLVIGFACESNDYETNAKTKLKNKNLDLIVMNKTQFMGLNHHNEFAICGQNFYQELGQISKEHLAKILVAKIISLSEIFY